MFLGCKMLIIELDTEYNGGLKLIGIVIVSFYIHYTIVGVTKLPVSYVYLVISCP